MKALSYGAHIVEISSWHPKAEKSCEQFFVYNLRAFIPMAYVYTMRGLKIALKTISTSVYCNPTTIPCIPFETCYV